MSQLPGLHPDSVLYRTIVNTFSACLATKMVLDVVLLMREQVRPECGFERCINSTLQFTHHSYSYSCRSYCYCYSTHKSLNS
jgi:hypothetical protein